MRNHTAGTSVLLLLDFSRNAEYSFFLASGKGKEDLYT